MKARLSIAAMVLALIATLAPSGEVAAGADELKPAIVVAAVVPRVFAPAVTTNVVLTGSDFVAGTVFGSPTPGFVVNSTTIESPTQATLNITTPPTPVRAVLTATPPGLPEQVVAVVFVRTAEGTFFPVTPVHTSDTRSGIGGRTTPLGPKGTYTVKVTGIGEVPATNVSGVVLNVTATDTTSASFVAVYPSGATLPTVSNLNFGPNQTIPNHVTVGVGADGLIAIYNDAGTANIIVDVVGYYVTAAGTTGAGYQPRSGTPRVLDTRSGTPIPAFGTFNLTITNAAAIGIIGAVYNVTVDQPKSTGFLTAYPLGAARPDTSSVNFRAGQPAPNLVTVKVGTNNAISFYNGSNGTVHLILDGIGFYTTSTDSFTYIVRPAPGGPFRLWDSRINLGRPLDPQEVFSVSGSALPNATTAGVIANATVTQPSAGGFATIYPAGLVQPSSSNLNFTANETRANQVIPAVLVSTNRDIAVYNDTGTAHFILDVFAYLEGF